MRLTASRASRGLLLLSPLAFFISMAGVGLTESILPTIAESIGLTFSGPAGHLLQVATYLRTRKILLVVDNM